MAAGNIPVIVNISDILRINEGVVDYIQMKYQYIPLNKATLLPDIAYDKQVTRFLQANTTGNSRTPIQ